MCPDILPDYLIRHPMIKKNRLFYMDFITLLCMFSAYSSWNKLYMPDNFSYLEIYSHNYAHFTYILTQRPVCGSGN